MEELFEATGFVPEMIFCGITEDIIDYVICSYTVDIEMIMKWFYKPQLKLICGMVYKGCENIQPRVITPEKGIFHGKMVIVTTKNVVRILLLTANMTWNLCHGNSNDVYRLTAKRDHVNKHEETAFLTKYLISVGISLEIPLNSFNTKGIKGIILGSIPNVTSLSKEIHEVFKRKQLSEGQARITASSCNFEFWIGESIHCKEITFLKPKDFQNRNKWWYLFYLNEGKGSMKIEEKVYEIPYHYKRYIMNFKEIECKLITSANISFAAWGTPRHNSYNYELGVLWFS